MTKIVVVDMDGCLCSLNSFRYWLVFAFLFSLISFRWLALFKLCVIVALRIIGRVGRVQMKRDVLAVTENFPGFYIKWFSRFLFRFTNSSVLAEMQRYDDLPVLVVLSTAAPTCYVSEYTSHFDFAHVFATPSVHEDGWKENIGREKLESLERFYGKDISLICVISDHHDDLPLLLNAEKRLLVKPSSTTLKSIAGRFKFDII